LLSCVSDGRIHTLPLKTSYEKFERVRRKWHAAHVLVPNEAVDIDWTKISPRSPTKPLLNWNRFSCRATPCHSTAVT
jgi:hypothetical protein